MLCFALPHDVDERAVKPMRGALAQKKKLKSCSILPLSALSLQKTGGSGQNNQRTNLRVNLEVVLNRPAPEVGSYLDNWDLKGPPLHRWQCEIALEIMDTRAGTHKSKKKARTANNKLTLSANLASK